ncbi:MAG: ribonuclease J, partial [Clostridia bacterium]|nr:ribonuclease J [Clostridia bacterium]
MLDNLMTSEEFDKTISSNADLKAGKPKFKPSQNKKEVAKKQNNANKGGKGNNAKSQSKNPRPQPKHVEVEKQDVVYSTEDDHTEKQAKPRANNLKVMFLGGIGEIGKNMTVLEYGKDIIVIDCGVMFPSVDMLGIDLVVPDVTYLVENKDKVRGFLITHGHEDHIGSVPYVIGEVSAPIYASKMTCGLIKKKMEEHKKVEYKAVAVKPKQKIKLGCFEIEFIHVNHAIPGAFALAIKTPVGMVVHTGDYKIDLTPIYDEKFDFQSFASLGEQGVLLYMSDSTNAEREGYSLSERVVGETLERLFVENKDRRMVVAAFASNVDRMQEVMNLAEKYKRKVVLTGRSMVNVTDVATQIGEMKINKDNIIEVEKMKNFKDSELCILSTGSQGEPNSALSRMAASLHRKVTIHPG